MTKIGALEQLAQSQHSLFSLDQARSSGIHPNNIYKYTSEGHFIKVLPSIFACKGDQLTNTQKLVALYLAYNSSLAISANDLCMVLPGDYLFDFCSGQVDRGFYQKFDLIKIRPTRVKTDNWPIPHVLSKLRKSTKLFFHNGLWFEHPIMSIVSRLRSIRARYRDWREIAQDALHDRLVLLKRLQIINPTSFDILMREVRNTERTNIQLIKSWFETLETPLICSPAIFSSPLYALLGRQPVASILGGYRQTVFTRFEIIDTIKSLFKEDLPTNNSLEAAILFGSVARGDSGSASDIDLLFLTSARPTDNFMPVKCYDYLNKHNLAVDILYADITTFLEKRKQVYQIILNEGVNVSWKT